jgi:ferritin-like metal-binding protein YciE
MDQPIIRYLQDAIAAEKSFEDQLKGFAAEATYARARSVFETHAEETRQQYEALTARIEQLGGSTSTFKSLIAHVFGMSPKMAQLGHAEEEKTTQDLMMAFAVENAEVAMYESLKIAAEIAGDQPTADLAQGIQVQEQQTAVKVWEMLAPAAEQGISAAQHKEDSGLQGTMMRYLEDAEAAERNFEDALAGFSKAGDQTDVQSLMAMMSEKARTQHERLRARLEVLGGSRSASKSILAHLLAFSPLSAQTGHEDAEKSTQHLMITYSAAAAEMAMYESLGVAAKMAGDHETAMLAQQLQSEEKEDYRAGRRVDAASAHRISDF